MKIEELINEHIDIWTSAQEPKTNGGRGRGNNSNGQTHYGIKKLRELILELAVRGKLVPQEPGDEPASVLLERIAEEKNRLVKEGKIKKQKALPEIGEDERPFDLPKGWEWVRLGNVGVWGAGSTPDRKKSAFYGGEMPWFKSGELKDNEKLIHSEETVTTEALKKCSLRLCKPNDVLLAMYGATIGMAAILATTATTNQAVCACTCYSGIFNQYLFLFLKAWRPKFTRQGAGGAQPNISKVKIENTPASFPPLLEQHRIVTKVNELMALCDQLEKQQTDNNMTHQILVETLLAALTSTTNAKDFDKTWQRIADNFDILFTTEHSIDQLKQTILQLAVMGKLVPQDPNDEPASVLLEKIAKEKKRLIKEEKIKKQKPLLKIKENEIPYILPNNWIWARLGAVSEVIMGQSPPGDTYNDTGDGTPLVNGPVEFSNGPFGNTIKSKFTTSPTKLCKKGDLLLCVRGSTTGRTNISDFDACIGRGVAAIKGNIFQMYLNWFIVSMRDSIYSKGTGSTFPSISYDKIINLLCPVPPLIEQQKIVKKVYHLMNLCDEIKERLNRSQTTKKDIAYTIVTSLQKA